MVARFLFLFLVSFFFMSVNSSQAADYHQVNNGSTKTIDEHGTCKKVTNNIGNHLFVPTKTSTEWSAFRSNLPSGVSLGNCLPTCGAMQAGNWCASPRISANIISSIWNYSLSVSGCYNWCKTISGVRVCEFYPGSPGSDNSAPTPSTCYAWGPCSVGNVGGSYVYAATCN